MYFSYGQFLVYDKSIETPECDWTKQHYKQGFARRESNVCFATILEFGHADVSICSGRYEKLDRYERVIAVPFLIRSGKIIVVGPEELEVERGFDILTGHYRLIAAQSVMADESEVIDLFFEPVAAPSQFSEILLADEELDPPTVLLEFAKPIGET
jgi:hypothetical protein